MRFRSLTALVGALLLAAAAYTVRAESKAATVKGYVIDSACTFTKNLKKPISPECAQACAKAGSPLQKRGRVRALQRGAGTSIGLTKPL